MATASASATNISTRPNTSGFSAVAPVAAVPVPDIAIPAPIPAPAIARPAPIAIQPASVTAPAPSAPASAFCADAIPATAGAM